MVKPGASPRILQGEVWLVALDPTIGSEIQKSRPCMIVSPAEFHDHLRTVLAVPMTTGSRPASWRVAVRFGGKDGLLLPEQLRALDRRRLIKRLGMVESDVLRAVLAGLRQLFAG